MLRELLEVFGQTRNLKWLKSELGFAHHPKMLEAKQATANTTIPWQVLQKLAYRQDPDDMCGNLNKQQAYHEQRQKGAKRKAGLMLGPKDENGGGGMNELYLTGVINRDRRNGCD